MYEMPAAFGQIDTAMPVESQEKRRYYPLNSISLPSIQNVKILRLEEALTFVSSSEKLNNSNLDVNEIKSKRNLTRE